MNTNPLEIEEVVFNLLLQSNYNKLKTLCKTSKLANNICNNNNFWLNKFELENIPIFFKHKNYIEEYRKYNDALLTAYDIITISLLEKELDQNNNILFKNEGTIDVNFPELSDIDDQDLNKMISIIPEMLTENIEKYKKNNYVPISLTFKYIDNDNYELIYLVAYEDEDDEDDDDEDDEDPGQGEYEETIVVSKNRLKNILALHIYLFGSLSQITDTMLAPYNFEDYEPYPKNSTNSQYHNMVKFRRIGMLEMLKHQRKL